MYYIVLCTSLCCTIALCNIKCYLVLHITAMFNSWQGMVDWAGRGRVLTKSSDYATYQATCIPSKQPNTTNHENHELQTKHHESSGLTCLRPNPKPWIPTPKPWTKPQTALYLSPTVSSLLRFRVYGLGAWSKNHAGLEGAWRMCL